MDAEKQDCTSAQLELDRLAELAWAALIAAPDTAEYDLSEFAGAAYNLAAAFIAERTRQRARVGAREADGR